MYSVLMSVYYKEKAEYLNEAMESIWNQTVLTDDFVLVCDGPLTDELENVIANNKKNHPQLNIVRLAKNSGLGVALNTGLKVCKNELVARMDSDDISLPRRCELQLNEFKTHPQISILSGVIEEFCDDEVQSKRILPITMEEIVPFSKKRNPFSHPAVMFKKTDVLKSGGYNERFHLLEDYYLWIRMFINGYTGRNLTETILKMRVPLDMFSRRGGTKYAKEIFKFFCWMKEIGWINYKEFFYGSILRVIYSMLPNTIKKIMFKLARK